MTCHIKPTPLFDFASQQVSSHNDHLEISNHPLTSPFRIRSSEAMAFSFGRYCDADKATGLTDRQHGSSTSSAFHLSLRINL